MKRKTQQSLFSTWDKLKKNRDDTNEGHKLFSFKNVIKISSFISSECTRNLISSLNIVTCNPVLGSHMEDFREQISAKISSFFLVKLLFFNKEQNHDCLKYTEMHILEPQFQNFSGEAPGPPNKRLRLPPPLHMAPITPFHVFLSALFATYSKLFSLYFKFSGEPW